MPSEKVKSLDDLRKGPYFLYLYYRDTNGHIKTLRCKLSDLRDGPAQEQEFIVRAEAEGGIPTGIDIADSNGHFYRMDYTLE